MKANWQRRAQKIILVAGNLDRLPIRIITAPEDSEWDKSQTALKGWSSDSTQIVVNGAGHGIYQSHPDVVNIEIKNWLKIINSRYFIKI